MLTQGDDLAHRERHARGQFLRHEDGREPLLLELPAQLEEVARELIRLAGEEQHLIAPRQKVEQLARRVDANADARHKAGDPKDKPSQQAS